MKLTDKAMRGDSPDNGVASGRVAWLCRLLLVVVIFAGRPLALVVPVGVGVTGTFHLQLPVLLWLSLLCTGGFLAMLTGVPASGGRPRGWLRWGALAGLGGCLGASRASSTFSYGAALTCAGYFTIPAFIAMAPRRFLPRHLPEVLGILWLVNVGHGLAQWSRGVSVVGLAGNRNWFACLVVATLPWALLAWKRRPYGRLPKVVGSLAVLVLSLLLLWRAESRGAWLAAILGCICLAAGRWLRGWRYGAVLVGGVVLTAGIIGWGLMPHLAGLSERDIRIPLWRGTVALIADHPMAGVGPGNFRGAFPSYRLPEQLSRRVAAPATTHPHNQFLALAAEVGLPLALLWVGMLVPFLAGPRPTPFGWCVYASAFVVVAQSFLDKTLVQPPTAALGLMMVGFLWRPLGVDWRRGGGASWSAHRLIAILLAVPLIGLAILSGVRELATSLWMRRGLQLESAGQHAAAHRAYRSAGAWSPADAAPYAYAGTVAVKHLQQPEQGLQDLQKARQYEPDFGHLNGTMGLALGMLGKHRDALPFFRRETELFPADPLAQARLLRCYLRLGMRDSALQADRRLAAVRYADTVRRLGHEETQRLASKWLAAVAAGDARAALLTAIRLVGELPTTDTPEPGAAAVAEAAGFGKAFLGPAFQTGDLPYWQRLVAAARCAGQGDGGTGDLVALLKREDGGVLAERILCLRQAGYRVAVVRAPPPQTTTVLAVRRKGQNWLARLGSEGDPVVVADGFAQLLAAASAAGERLDLPGMLPFGLEVPVSPQAFCPRNRILGQLVVAALGDAAPTFGGSPNLERWEWIVAAGDAATSVTFRPLPGPRSHGTGTTRDAN